MSHPEEPAGTPPAAAAVEAVAAEGPAMAPPATATPATDEPVPSGAPYRVPSPPLATVEAEEPELYLGVPAKRPRPLLGPTLSVYAVLLWTFVIAGQFTTSWLFGTPLGQGTAVVSVMLLTFTAWIVSLRRSRVAVPPQTTGRFVWRAIGVGVLTFLLFFFTIVGATALGSISSGNHDIVIALALVLVSLFAAIAGPRMTAPSAPSRTHGQRVALVMMWIAGTLLTLVAGADLAAHG